MNTKMKKVVLCALSAGMILSAFGCGKKADSGRTEDGKILLKMETADKAANEKGYNLAMEKYAKFEAENSDVKIEPVNYTFNVRDYAAKAAGNQLPTFYYVPLTEAKNCIEMGYAADVKKWLDERGFTEYIADFIMKNISKDGGIYFYPTDTYDSGIAMNIDLLKKAGYMNADGTPIQPETWEDLAKMAQKIKEVTGVAGFVMPTMNNAGGWRFTPIAWSYGVDFMEKIDGKWTATFDTQEAVDALQFIKDLKWKYNVVPENNLLENSQAIKVFAAGEAAMTMSEGNSVDSMIKSGMSKDNIAMVQMPKGPKRWVTLLGGGYRVFNAKHTDEQLEAAFRYMDWNGEGIELDDTKKENIEKAYLAKAENNEIVGLIGLSPWKDETPTRQYTLDMIDKYANIDMNHVKLYNNKETGIEYQEEEPVEAQALYGVLDSCIQAVWTDPNADCAALIHDAAVNFQANYLDYAE